MQNMTPRCAPDERLELVDPADPALAGTSRSRILRNCLTTLVCISFLLRTGTVNAQFSIAATGTTYTQDFNSLTNGAWADGSTLNGWYARTDATPTISSYGANTGSTTTAGLYAFGVAGVGPLTDRALGYAPSNAFTGSAGTGKGYVGWRLKNNTGVTVAGVTVTWTGEQWRDNNNSAAHSLELSWQTGAVVSDPVGGPWTPAAPSFTSPQHSGGTAVLDGNSATNRTVGISVTFSVTIPAGEEIMLRWEDLNNSGNDHFLTIDDVSVSVSCIDSDGDSVCDELDGCPSDPLKTAAGICGCGVADTDSDSDGTADCNDGCPNDPLKTAAGICGCGVADTDSDGDGTADCNDGCPNDPLKTAAGICGCGVADTDSDSDGTADCNDLCPADPLKIAPGLCGCGIPEGSCNDCLGVPAGPDQPGTPCNDGDACTVNDTWSLGCICSGTYEDLDNDGICDANEDEPNMRLGVVEAPGNMLELRLLPDHFFNDLVSATVITVRWLTTPGVSITGASAAYVDPAYTPAVGALQYGGTTTDGPYSYATFFTFGNGSLFDEGISWTANTEVPFFRVPYVNNTLSCVTFEVMDDTYQIDNNLQWFISLNALDKTDGYIPGKTSVCADPSSVMITSKVILEGGWQSGPSLMRDDLRVLANFPLAHPYGSAPFNHSGTETTTPSVLAAAGSNAIVDWVLLELRDPLTPALVLASRAALLQRDGDIVDVNGIDPVTFNGTTPGNYYLAVRHRNHLGIMTTSALAMSPMTPMIDFTLGSTPTYGTDARTTLGPVSAMWCGNVEPDDQLKYTGSTNDRDPILVAIGAIPTATVTDYLPTDVTLDGVVKYTGAGNDRDPILVNIGGSVPTAIRPEQLP